MAQAQNNVLMQLAWLPSTPLTASQVRAVLGPTNYGREWCLTDVLRLPYEARVRLLDVICGCTGPRAASDPQARLRMGVRLRTVYKEPVVVIGCRPPVGAVPPAALTEANGTQHHHPSQWEEQELARFEPGEFSVQAVSEDPFDSAVFLLNKMGWMCKEGGKQKHRFVEKNLRASKREADQLVLEDQWQLIEVAFETMYPKLVPPAGLESPTATMDAAPAKSVRRGGKIAAPAP